MAVLLLPVVLLRSAATPVAVFLLPVVVVLPEFHPTKVLLVPVVIASPASTPMNTFVASLLFASNIGVPLEFWSWIKGLVIDWVELALMMSWVVSVVPAISSFAPGVVVPMPTRSEELIQKAGVVLYAPVSV